MAIDGLLIAMLAVCASSILLAVALFVIKVLHRQRLAAQEQRRSTYISTLGDVMAREETPAEQPVEWADDPVFLDVLFEYVSIVTGAGRSTLYRLIDGLDIRTRLMREVRRCRSTRKRLRALIYLVEIAGPRQRGLFYECLADDVAEVRLHAARGLAVIRDERAVPRLLELLQDETPWNTGRLADILVSFGPGAVPYLTQYLVAAVQHPQGNPDATREVVRAVGLIGDLSAEPVLIDLLEADEPLLRVGAASALAHCGTPASVPHLIRALDDEDWRVRARAADALAVFADSTAVQPLAAKMRDSAWWVRQNAAKALAEVPGGIERLADALNDPDQFCRDAARHQLGTKNVIRASRHRIEAGIGTPLDRRIVAASQATIEDLLCENDLNAAASKRILVGDGVVDRLRAYAASSTLDLVERLRRLRLSIANGSRRFPSFQDAGGSGPFQPGGPGGGGFRPVGGQFTTQQRLAREEARVRAELREELGGDELETGT